MSPRAYSRLAWSLWVLVMAFGAAFVVLSLWSSLDSASSLEGLDYLSEILWFGVLVPVAAPAYATVGAVVASLRPKNGIGWLCLFFSILLLGASWQPGAVSLIDRMEVLQNLAWLLLAPPLPLTLMLLIFPDGCLPSRRWRFAVWTALMGFCIVVIADSLPSFRAGVEAAQTVGLLTSLVAFIASMVAVIFRWRRSGGQERQQLKWLVYVGAVTIAAALGGVTSLYVQDDIAGAWSYSTVFGLVVALAGVMVGVPFAMGVAILKHRLYDIDRLINRTLVYATLTASLALVYFGAVTATQAILQTSTGQERLPQLVIVASTLVIAALFNPLRRRIQSFIDRRFYRRKYDARKTLESFSTKLRDETDLDALNDDLVGVVRETMQPAHASLWLRSPTEVGRGEEPSG